MPAAATIATHTSPVIDRIVCPLSGWVELLAVAAHDGLRLILSVRLLFHKILSQVALVNLVLCLAQFEPIGNFGLFIFLAGLSEKPIAPAPIAPAAIIGR